MNTIVLGLGNRILSDDGVGPRVASALGDLSGKDGISVEEANAGGLGLLELLTGHDRAIIIDAMPSAEGEAGRIRRFDIKELAVPRHAGTAHDFDLVTALGLGRRLGMALPRQIEIFAVGVNDVATLSEECTPEVEKAALICAGMIRRELAGRRFDA
jgi:hydrogenase maturation protease